MVDLNTFFFSVSNTKRHPLSVFILLYPYTATGSLLTVKTRQLFFSKLPSWPCPCLLSSLVCPHFPLPPLVTLHQTSWGWASYCGTPAHLSSWEVLSSSTLDECPNQYRNKGSLIGFSEKAMAPHSSTLAWKMPWTEEPGRLQSMGSLRIGYDWATSLSLFIFMHWRRKWKATSVFLPGESQGWGSLVGCRLWGRTESDTTEAT